MRLRDRFDRKKRTPSTRNQRIGFALFWLLVLAFAYVIPTAPNFNTESHLYVAFSVVDHHTLNIDAYHRRLGDESYYRGHYYSDKAPGLSFLAIPVYSVLKVAFPGHVPQQYTASGKIYYDIPRSTVYIRYAITYVLLILPAAIFGVLLWLFVTGFIPSGWALLLAATYSLGTTGRIYSMWYFSHQICAMLLFGAFMLIFTRVRAASLDRRAILSAALAGLLAGYAVISEYPTAVIAVVLGGYLLTIARPRLPATAAYLAGMVPAAALGVAYNILAFGKPLATGYNFVNSSMYRHGVSGGSTGLGNPTSYGIQMPSWTSIWQITFGPYRGIFLLCPVLLIFFVGVAHMWRRRALRPELWLCVAVVGAYFLLDASRPPDVNGWAGGYSVGSRHLVPMLPFMVFPMAFALGDRRWRVVFLALAAISIAIMTATTLTPTNQGFSFAEQNPLVHELWPDLSGGAVAVNWGYTLGLQGVVSLLPLLVISAALCTRLALLFRRPPAALSPAADAVIQQATVS